MVMSDKAFVLVALAGGLSAGVYAGWSGLLANIMMPAGYTQDEVAWIGMASPLAAMVGGVAVGKIAGLLRTRHKFLTVTLFILTIVSFGLFMLAVRLELSGIVKFRTSANGLAYSCFSLSPWIDAGYGLYIPLVDVFDYSLFNIRLRLECNNSNRDGNVR